MCPVRYRHAVAPTEMNLRLPDGNLVSFPPFIGASRMALPNLQQSRKPLMGFEAQICKSLAANSPDDSVNS